MKKMKPIRRISRKQKKKNQEINKIKKEMEAICSVCGKWGANDAAHIIPKATFPQYYTEKWNIVIMCRECHDKYDESKEVRQEQDKLYKRALNNARKEDRGRIMNYFNKII